MELILDIQYPGGETKVTLNEEGASLGRGEAAQVRIDHPGLSRLHASVSRRNEEGVIADAGSVNGTFVNGRSVTPAGTALRNRDVIKLGESTIIRVTLGAAAPAGRRAERQKAGKKENERKPRLALATAIVLSLVILAGVAALGIDKLREPSEPDSAPATPGVISPLARITPGITPSETPVITPAASPAPSRASLAPYLKMSEVEQYNFLSLKARNITRMMGNREYVFDREALGYIKYYVDGYAKRVGNESRTL